jgi:hypothetical protein
MEIVCSSYIQLILHPARRKMTRTESPSRGFTAWTASGLVAGIAVVLVAGTFMAEGLLGYFYSASMFWEGLDHIWLIYGGLAVAIAGAALAIYSYLRR